MQLVAYGAQDIYLTGQPNFTFFKNNLRRHTNFSVEAIEQTFNGSVNFGKNSSLKIGRNGDLISNIYFNATISYKTSSANMKAGWIKNIGTELIKSVDCNIGGQKVDKHYSEWLNIWHEVSSDDDQGDGWNTMTGNLPSNTDLKKGTGNTGDRQIEIFVPLRFWFTRHPGLTLPLISLQYHEVGLDFEFLSSNEATNRDGTVWDGTTTTQVDCNIDNAQCIVDYVYLDTEERKKFAQTSHEYVIEQVQQSSTESIPANTGSRSITLTFNHPVKALYWVVSQDKWSDGSNKFLGNDLVSATKNFINRYVLSGLTRTGTRLPTGGRATFGVSNEGTITITMNSSGATDTTTSLFTENEKIEIGIDLNKSSVHYNEIVGVLSSAHFTANTTSTFVPDMLNWNSITLGSLLPAEVASMVIGTGTGELEAASNVFATAPTVSGAYANGTFVYLRESSNFSTNINETGQTIQKAKLKLNGNDRFKEREAVYFNKVQPWQNSQNVPKDGVYVYSFALKPNDIMPSGSCNFSRIDNSQLELTFNSNNKASSATVYAMNYNVLRIMSGMGGLAYSN